MKKNKLNFGHGILVVILLFMSGISFLVYKCSKQNVELVNPAYYEMELKYDDQLSKEINSKMMGTDLKISYDANAGCVVIHYPSLEKSKTITGFVSFYKPDNSSLDFSKPVVTDQESEQLIQTSGLHRGAWNVRVNWNAGTTACYTESKIFLN